MSKNRQGNGKGVVVAVCLNATTTTICQHAMVGTGTAAYYRVKAIGTVLQNSVSFSSEFFPPADPHISAGRSSLLEKTQ